MFINIKIKIINATELENNETHTQVNNTACN